MRVRVGTSGYSYTAWRPGFYPEGTSPRDFLRFYASRFDTVEINATFRRMPSEATLANWKAQVPRDFVFALKAPMAITHRKRLRDAAQPTNYFERMLGALGRQRGPVLFQLPPNLRRDVPRLTDFLALLPPDREAAFEFRHESWFDDAVYDALRAHGVSLCIAETDALATPLVATTRFGYLRLREVDYTRRELVRWCERILAEPWSTAYVFFKHEDERGPKLAARLLSLVAEEMTAHPR